jgi:ribonuclease III
MGSNANKYVNSIPLSTSNPLAETLITPYNVLNHIICHDELISLLKSYDVDQTYNNIDVYRKAFVHKSYCTRKNENVLNGNINCPDNCLPLQEESNERLEFLGDSILGKVVAAYLFERYPDENEGFLTKMRTKLVNGKMLAHLSELVGLKPYIILSKQIEEGDGRNSVNILEDAFEAFIGAIYIDFGDKGDEMSRKWIISVIENNLDFAELIRNNHNYKDIFLKYFQQNFNYIPKFFEMKVETVNNQKKYSVCIKDNKSNIISIGYGASKKEAENDASKNGLNEYACEYKF